MKKYLTVILSMACAFHLSHAAFAVNPDPVLYKPKKPAVEVDLSVLDDIATGQGQPPAATVMTQAPQLSKPVTLTPPQELPPVAAAALSKEAAENASDDSTTEFLDSIMAYHVPAGTKKKPVKAAPAPVPMRKPVALETPKAEKPAEAKKAAAAPAETKPVMMEAPKAEQPAETAKPAAAPAVQERRSRSPEAAAAPSPTAQGGDITIGFDKNSSDLTPANEKGLDALAAKLKDMPNQRLQIRAYASDTESNESNARRMSLSRGLVVRAYLVEKGVKPINLDVRALGSEGSAGAQDQVVLGFVK
jgi:outer membrane protein OmpA-like peptidoglycan-associated protein